jgi:hypothetical protein
MEEAAENGKELSHCAHGNGMNELLILFVFYCHDSFCTVPNGIVMTSFVSTLVDLWNTE